MRETWIKPGCVFSHELFCLEQYMGEVPSTSELEQLVCIYIARITVFANQPRTNIDNFGRRTDCFGMRLVVLFIHNEAFQRQ